MHPVERKRTMHRLPVIGRSHSQADISIYSPIVFRPNPVHRHMGAATMRQQHDFLITIVTQEFNTRLDARMGVVKYRNIVVIFGVLAEHRHLQR